MSRQVTSRNVVNSSLYHVPVPSFTQSVVVPPGGTTIYVSGITARKADGEIVGKGDVEAQTRQVFESIQAILAESGATLDDVVQMVTHVRHADDIRKISAIRLEYLGAPPPTSTTVEVSRLFDPEQLLEVTVTAVIPAGRGA